MFVYNISELIELLQSAHKDGFEYVSLSILEADPTEEDCNTDSLDLEYIVSEYETQSESIDSVVLPDDYELDLYESDM